MNSSSRLLIGVQTFTCILLVLYIQETSGLRGCSSFGHSCFGAHGKRVVNDDGDATRPSYGQDRADIVTENRNYGGAFGLDGPPMTAVDHQDQSPTSSSNRRYIPFAILRLLRKLANDAEDRTTTV